MQVILLENVRNLGKRGELKEVAEGYAVNFLVPKKLAQLATADSVEELRKKQEENLKKDKENEERLKKMAFAIKDKKIFIKAKSEKEKLFGSIGKKEIFTEIKKLGLELPENSIILKEPIKTTGEKEITLDFGKNIKTKIAVIVEKA
jgi:large subunit ribosomal protein L9